MKLPRCLFSLSRAGQGVTGSKVRRLPLRERADINAGVLVGGKSWIDISTLYREFTDARKMPLAQRAVAGSQGHALPSRSTLTTAKLDIFWRSKPHSKIGKPCKTPVPRTGPRSWGNTAGNKVKNLHALTRDTLTRSPA